MNKRKRKALVQEVKKMVIETLDSELKNLLHDVTYRIGVLNEEMKKAKGLPHKVTSGMLNLGAHQLDGFVFNDNTPSAGNVSWTDCNIVFKGITYIITNGSTNQKYVYWQRTANPNTVFQTSDTKPTLADDDVLILVNESGTHRLVVGVGKMTPGGALYDGAVDSTELANGAVLGTKLADLAVSSGKMAEGAVTATKIGSGAVTEVKIGSSAVTAGKIGTGAVTEAKIGSNAITAVKVSTGAITETKLGDNAVTSDKVSTGAITETKLAGNAVTSAKIADGSVIGDKLATGAVTDVKIGTGAVAASKLDLAAHFLF